MKSNTRDHLCRGIIKRKSLNNLPFHFQVLRLIESVGCCGREWGPVIWMKSVGCSRSSTIKEQDVYPGARKKNFEVGNEKTGFDGDVCVGACTITAEVGNELEEAKAGVDGNGVATVLTFGLRTFGWQTYDVISSYEFDVGIKLI